MSRSLTAELEVAPASYGRCQRAPEFFRTFYNRFLASDHAIPPMFAQTRFDRQDRLLQHDAVRTHDPERDVGVEAAWHAALAPGIAFMQEYGP